MCDGGAVVVVVVEGKLLDGAKRHPSGHSVKTDVTGRIFSGGGLQCNRFQAAFGGFSEYPEDHNQPNRCQAAMGESRG